MSDDAPSIESTVLRAAMASVPWVGGAAEVIYSDWRARQATKAELTLNEILGVTGDQVLQKRLAENGFVEAVFVQGVQAALSTGLEAKRRLLVKAVAEAIVDDAKLDESWVITDALAQLDVPHVRALDALDREWEERPEPDPSKGDIGKSDVWASLPSPVKAALIRTGTGFGPIGGGTFTYHSLAKRNKQEGITSFGIDLVRQLRDGDPETPWRI